MSDVRRAERALLDDLLEGLPDKPRWVMARGLCLSGRCDVILGPEGREQAGYFVVDADRPRACQAVFRPVAGLVEELRARYPECSLILAHTESSEHLRSLLPGWVARPVTAHIAPSEEALPRFDIEVRLLGPHDRELLSGLHARLRADLAIALANGPLSAAFAGGKPVGFCYAAYETETWWDVVVDTARGYRRRGFASAAAVHLVRYMRARGKRAVWGALDANKASHGMALKYGFRAIDRLIAFTPAERRATRRS